MVRPEGKEQQQKLIMPAKCKRKVVEEKQTVHTEYGIKCT